MRGGLVKRSLSTVSKDSNEEGSWRSARLLKPYFRRHFLRLLGGFSALVIVDLLQLFIPRIVKHAVDSLQKGVATQRGLLEYGLYIVLIAIADCRLSVHLAPAYPGIFTHSGNRPEKQDVLASAWPR